MISWMAEAMPADTISIWSLLTRALAWIESVRKYCRESILVRTIERFRSGTAGSVSSFKDSTELSGGV
ncbi:zinc finger protein STOP1-like protein [Pyrus ussuriensis x Pyrus communis]|uniref:Zinc finger protein STOP1-like protein n=1 Tax=Pyrus ussuriensis x Pyrus communis TaxID=2448454 RepID=A0A5N5GQQ3_9ROSA|nr:zinc finger protein STOP1-like protein [Pyrus ussuriensis x Pyrus communis]